MCAEKGILLRKTFWLVIIGLLLLSFEISQGREIQNHNLVSERDSKPLSVVLMIGDGMGFQHVQLARWIEKGVNGTLNMEKLPIHLEVSTQSANSPVTDSAAAATAIATGNKTNNGMLSYLENGQTLKTILEIANERNLSTGLITTTEIFHATPAAFYSHVRSRSNTSEIVNQLSNQSSIDLFLGGGSSAFSSVTLMKMEQEGYTYVSNRTQLAAVNTGKVLGLFSPNSISYEQNRDPDVTPSLSEMTNKSLELLSRDENGFFLLVEGGKIDWGAHVNNKFDTALETIEFDHAVDVATTFIESHPNHEILLLVTADHETGGFSIEGNTLNDSLPSVTRTYTQNKALRLARVANVSVTWSTTGHTGQVVPLYGFGTVLSHLNDMNIDNTAIFGIMKSHLFSTALTTPTTTPSTTRPILWSRFGVLLPFFSLVILSIFGKKRRQRID